MKRRSWIFVGASVLALISATVAGCGSSKPAASPTHGVASSSAAASTSSATSAAPSPTASVHVVSSVVTYPWNWPNSAVQPCVVKHSYQVPPLPVLTKIAVGEHYEAKPTFDRITFTFTGTFPGYDVSWVSELVADPSGKPVVLEGNDILRIRFTEADAHNASGSTIISAPPAHVGYKAINSYAQAGDFEGVITYGVANYRTITNSNPQPPVRIIEVKTTDGHGGYLYIVAIDIQNRGMGGNPVTA